MRISNPIPWQLYKYLSRSAFLANLTPENRQFFKVKSESNSHGHDSNSETIKKFIILLEVQVGGFFKQLPLNTKQNFEL